MKYLIQDEQEPEGEDLVDSEEYDEDEDTDARHRKKRKKDSRYGGFIIDEAEVRPLFSFTLDTILYYSIASLSMWMGRHIQSTYIKLQAVWHKVKT